MKICSVFVAAASGLFAPADADRLLAMEGLEYDEALTLASVSLSADVDGTQLYAGGSKSGKSKSGKSKSGKAKSGKAKSGKAKSGKATCPSTKASKSGKGEAPMPMHKRRAMLHREHGKAVAASGKVEATTGIIKSNSGGGSHCDDKSGQTPTGFGCFGMDLLSFLSLPELGTVAATNLTDVCDEGDKGDEDPCPSEDEDERGEDRRGPRTGDPLGWDYANDMWAWESPASGKVYAILGVYDGTSFVDVTDPDAPIVLGFMETAGILPRGNCEDGFWRDMKVLGDVAYIGAEPENHGVQTFDLTRLDSLSQYWDGPAMPTRGEVRRLHPDSHITTIGASHNIVSFEEEQKILVVGLGGFATFNDTTACNSFAGDSVAVLDVAADKFDPPIECLGLQDLNQGDIPPYANWHNSIGYVHDAQCIVYKGPDQTYAGKSICFLFAETEAAVYDFTERRIISKFTYEFATFVHQGWVSEDHTVLYVNDEGDEECRSGVGPGCEAFDEEARPVTRIFDLSSLDNLVDPALFENENAFPSIDHNLYIDDGYVYSANYEAGARVYEIQGDKSLKDVAWFDTTGDCFDIKNCDDPYGGTWTHVPSPKKYSQKISYANGGHYGFSIFRVRV